VTVHDDVAELLGAYALHAVDADERALIEAHLEECPRCRAEVRDHELVAALLGNSGGDAPDGVWDRIASTLEEAAPPMRLVLPEGPAQVRRRVVGRRRPSARVALGLVAAAAVLLVAVLGVQVVRQDHRLGRLQAAMEDQAMLGAASVALSDPGAHKALLTSADGKLTATAVVLPDGTGYLMAQHMPVLGADRTYQLWGQTPGGLISLGLLGAHPDDVVAFHTTGGVAALAVTDEKAPGVVTSHNQPALAGTLD
jgi:hypothetical protein